MNPDNQLQQRGCVKCGEAEFHAQDCDLNDMPLYPIDRWPVLPTERTAEGEQPHKWQPVGSASAACKICPQHRDHPIHIRRTAEPEGEVPDVIFSCSQNTKELVRISANGEVTVNAETIDELRSAVSYMASVIHRQYRRDKTCRWVYDDIDDKWDSDCGESWQLTTGGPKENRMKHCHGCGGKLEVGQ